MKQSSMLPNYDGGFVSFVDGKGIISGKGKIKTGTLDFDDVYLCKELKYNLFSVSQMCDKKNNVLFTNTKCLVLSSNFKLLDESQVLLRVPIKDNIYIVDLKSVVPIGGLTCLFAKATTDESNLWHMRLGHINYKIMNKLIRGNLVRGIKREFNVARTPQQNSVAERKNRTLIEAARTMLVDSKLPTTFWAEAVNTACYVLNRALVIKSHNKTPYELIRGRPPLIDFMKPFDDQVTRSKVEGLLYQERKTEHINSTNSFNTVSSHANTAGPSFVNAALPSQINSAGTPASTNAFEEHPFERFSPFKNAFSLPHVPIVTPINDTGIFGNAYDDEAVVEEVDMNNVVLSYTIHDAPLAKFLKDHPKD
nr:ribonuclease H-like domain-containing protein [Tanacetum cinerariifolium]